jgi:hypothetical protein
MRASLLPLLTQALSDESLSAKSRGVFGYLVVVHSEGIPTSADLAKTIPEGRDAVRTAFRELLDRGYLVRYRVPLGRGSYRTETHFADVVGQTGLSGAGKPVPLSNTQPLVTSDVVVGSKTTNTQTSSLRSDVVCLGPSDEGPSPKEESVLRGYEDDESPGEAFGKIVDDPVPVTKTPRKARRYTRPLEKWTASDLVGHFIDRMDEQKIVRVGQVNTVRFGAVLKSWIAKGVPPAALHSAIGMFFDDPRNLRDIGQGFPLWLRFKFFYEDNQIAAGRKAGVEKAMVDETTERVIAGEHVTRGKKRF